MLRRDAQRRLELGRGKLSVVPAPQGLERRRRRRSESERRDERDKEGSAAQEIQSIGF
jgi:hypothetical protein